MKNPDEVLVETRSVPRLVWIGIALAAFAVVIFLFAFLAYGFGVSDYGQLTCFPSNPYPRCVSDLNEIYLSYALVLVGIALMAFGLYLALRKNGEK